MQIKNAKSIRKTTAKKEMKKDFYGKINSQRHTNKHSINLQINVPEQEKKRKRQNERKKVERKHTQELKCYLLWYIYATYVMIYINGAQQCVL